MGKNVIDYYKYWETDAIKADLDVKRHNFGVLAANIHGDFNVGSVVRNANAFLAREVILYGRKNYDRRGAVGTQNYTNFKHVREFGLADQTNNVPIIAIDNVDGAVAIDDFVWPTEYFLMCFGEEQVGVPKELLSIAQSVVYIKQYGSVRSLNVGCASAIAMYDYTSKLPPTLGPYTTKIVELVKEAIRRG